MVREGTMVNRSKGACHSFIPAAALLVLVGSAFAQEPLPEGDAGPNWEPSSTDPLMQQSDLGNVVQTARMHCNSGLRELARAEKIKAELTAELGDSAKREKLEKRLAKACALSEEAFREALAYDSDLREAYGGLGRVLGLQGKYEEALQVYAAGLRQSPEDLNCFRGWATTLLALDLLGNATSAYTSYVEGNPERAAILMDAMRQWLAEKQRDPGTLDPADIERLAQWIEQQDHQGGG